MMKWEHTSLDEILMDKSLFLAHIGREKDETLESHLDLAYEYFKKILEEKNLDEVFKKIYVSLNIKGKHLDLFTRMIADTVYLHDIGKINPEFQRFKMKNKHFQDKNYEKWFSSTEHSIQSSLIYIYLYLEDIIRIPLEKDRNTFIKLLYLNAYVISKHHSDFSNMEFERERNNGIISWLEDIFDLEEKYNCIFTSGLIRDGFIGDLDEHLGLIDECINYVQPASEYGMDYYIYSRLLYSVLVAADFYSTSAYMSNYSHQFSSIDVEGFKKIYYESNLLKSIREMKSCGDFDFSKMNHVRTKIFLEVEEKFLQTRDKNIFFLESPTGSGKSNIALNLSYKLLDDRIKKIIYAYPFNTLVEQNKNTLEKYYSGTDYEKYINVINSVTKIENNRIDDDSLDHWSSFTKMVLDRQFLHDPVVITSNVLLFKILFGNKRADLFSFYQLANSVIVLDEIQAYDYNLWQAIIETLERYSKLLNIKIILMSATLPDLSCFLNDDSRYRVAKLLENAKDYFEMPVFRKRVEINYELLNQEEIKYQDIFRHMVVNSLNKDKILIEFIRKKDAENFYTYVKDAIREISSHEILILTGDDNLHRRNEIIDILNMDLKKVILVSTQVVEAGLDIDMDIGYKDISILENEEQFLGRINRSSLKADCRAYFFNMFDARKIYGNKFARSYSLIDKERQVDLISKDFSQYYKIKLEALASKNKGITSAYGKFKRDIEYINYGDISQGMKLIKNDYKLIRVFFSRSIIFNGTLIKGEELWQEYKDLLADRNIDYATRYVKLHDLRIDMSLFIFEIPERIFKIDEIDDIAGGLYYIEDGSVYITEDGRLDLDKVSEEDIFI